MAKFSEVLTIVNGRNQKQVVCDDGKYPIYGSGGIMGYANDYICKAETVVIGRKGSINKPIFVETPFWNVDTAFGLCANSEKLNPKYLYYFCEKFDFEKLNTTVTIPSLTKSNLLNVEIPLPNLEKQKQIVELLDKVTSLIFLRKQQLSKFDELVKARFVEMFGDVLLNSMQWPEKTLENMADIVSGITKGRKTAEADLQEVPYMAVSNVKDGYIDWTTVKTILATRQEIEQYRLMPDDILMTEGGDPDKVGRGAIIKVPLKNSIHQNHIFRVRLDEQEILPSFFAEYLRHQKAKRYFLGCAKQTTGIASINMRQLRALPTLVPPLSLQKQFAAFVERVDRQKQTIQQSLEKLELMKKALMQEYFG
jgi:type I restriction enzyme S subunit